MRVDVDGWHLVGFLDSHDAKLTITRPLWLSDVLAAFAGAKVRIVDAKPGKVLTRLWHSPFPAETYQFLPPVETLLACGDLDLNEVAFAKRDMSALGLTAPTGHSVIPAGTHAALSATIGGPVAFTVEPMINAGTSAIRTDADGWAARTADGSLSAQFEHTVLIGPHGPEITTLLA